MRTSQASNGHPAFGCLRVLRVRHQTGDDNPRGAKPNRFHHFHDWRFHDGGQAGDSAQSRTWLCDLAVGEIESNVPKLAVWLKRHSAADINQSRLEK
jgi:hypothetical protein